MMMDLIGAYVLLSGSQMAELIERERLGGGDVSFGMSFDISKASCRSILFIFRLLLVG